MSGAKVNSRGFTLIAALLLTLLLSGIAVSLLLMVNTEQRVGGLDLNSAYMYRATEGAMEKMTSDLANTYMTIQAPQTSDICAINQNPPTNDPTITFTCPSGACIYEADPVIAGIDHACQITPPPSLPKPGWGQISAGQDAGLYAQLIPIQLNVAAQRVNDGANTGQTVSLTRAAQVALIPVFQFGVFCNGDCFFGRSPNLGFAGRVHTNGDLYLGVADGYNLVFGDKISAFGNVIREQMDNGVASSGNDNGGTVMIPTTANGCAAELANVASATTSSTCKDISVYLGATDGSVTGGHGSAQNTATWINTSTGTYNGYIIDGNGPGPSCPPANPNCDGPNSTGAVDLTLPFVQGTTSAVQLIRQPPPGESTSSLLGASRLANQAQIRIILSDSEDGLHLPGWNGNPAEDVQLVSGLPTELTAAGPLAMRQGADAGSPGTTANAIQVSSTFPINNGHYYTFGEAWCTGNKYPTATTIPGATYATSFTNSVIAGTVASGNYVYDTFNGTNTGVRNCPSLVPHGTYVNNIGAPPDTNFVIPPYYAGPGAASANFNWPPVAYPQWPPQTFPAPNLFTTINETQPSAGVAANGLEWPLIGGWLLVEVQNAAGAYVGVTQEWLSMGFARGVNVPTQPGTKCAAGLYTASAATYNIASNALNAAGANAIGCNSLADHRNAILYFEVTKDSQLAGEPSVPQDYPLSGADVYYDAGPAGPANWNEPCTTAGITCSAQYDWYPINLYDAREGEVNDTCCPTQGTGTPNGVMNVVELDVGNLNQWLEGNTGLTGTSVNYATSNGYILYFSDRRGMQFTNPAGPSQSQSQWGEYGFEDTVNYSDGAPYAPDGKLEPVNYNNVSPEDVNGNGVLDKYGVVGVGDAFGPNNQTDSDTTSPPNPYAQRSVAGERVQLSTVPASGKVGVGFANRVTGARHALKLVDASVGNLPVMPAASGCTQNAANPTGCGGFTVASENPVYVDGNYNSNCPAAGAVGCSPNNPVYDATWTGGAEPLHSAASIIADAVTVLSSNWQDWGCNSGAVGCNATLNTTSGSMVNSVNNAAGQNTPANTPNRIAQTTYYRMAVAGGKTIAFLNTAQNPEFAFGMDGGVHNFLRFIEDWGGMPGSAAQASLWYKGSLVSLYWNQYATGTFKCCNTVYNPPDREYVFDPLFSQPMNLPPGTPMFRNVDNLSYRQNFGATNY